MTGRALSPKASPGVDGVTWADYGQDLVAKSSSAAMRPISLSSINCHSSCRSRSLPVPAVAATFAQASAALTGTEPIGRFSGRRGLGERDSRPLPEAVGELVGQLPMIALWLASCSPSTLDVPVLAIEVTAGATVRSEDLAGLRHLAQRLGRRLVAGFVLYTGQQTLPFGDRLRALPIDALWNSAP